MTGLDAELVRMFLRRHTRLSLIVGTLTGVVAAGMTLLFPNLGVAEAGSLAQGWPSLMRELFGDPLAGFTNVYAWLELEVFHVTFWAVMVTLAAILASRIVAWEAEHRTLEVLLSVPQSRFAIVMSRWLAILLLLGLAALPVLVGSLTAVIALGLPLRANAIGLALGEGLLLSVVFASVALLVSMWVPRQIATVAATISLAAAGFLVETMLVPMVPALLPLSYVNPFHWYASADILVRGDFSAWPPLALAIMSAACIALSLAAFTARDIPG